MKPIIDLAGEKFGRWTVLSIGEKMGKHYGWNCICGCGTPRLVSGPSLRTGITTSCGCRRIEVSKKTFKTHGMAGTKLNRVWSGMKARCSNPKHESYANYGGRGIKVCNRWQSFDNFLADMGETYRDGLSIDRVDNDGDYEPNNCRWATLAEQATNKRYPKIETPMGPMTIREASVMFGIDLKKLRHRVWRGVPTERLFD